MRLLSIDWDFFFPEGSLDPNQWHLFDWSHGDSGSLYLNFIWYTRGAAFLRSGLSLPGLSGDEVDFWDRFTFSPRTRLFTADSHVHLYDRKVYRGVTEVVSFDAHHDGGYHGTFEEWLSKGEVSCENWAVALQASDVKCKVIYPRWKSWAMTAEPEPLVPLARSVDAGEGGHFDRIFVCRSGGWTPPWLDKQFSAFLKKCPVPQSKRIAIKSIEDRTWDQEQLIADMKGFIEMVETSQNPNVKNQFKAQVINSKQAVEMLQAN